MGPMKRPAAASVSGAKRHKEGHTQLPDKLPVSTLCGFLGAGKTTLLKHILESKRSDDDDFRCAVIVNDVAELNIDKSLIDQSDLVQSDDVIAMQNGCVCCTLQSDLVNQILNLARKKMFHYMIIEASGVSEPAQIAKLFTDCEEGHDHDQEHGREDALNRFAVLDTCVTVVDSADFFTKFDGIKQGTRHESFPQLLVEQIEYANVIVLNKSDLVSKAQLAKVNEQVSLLNSRAIIPTASSSKIDVLEVVNSGRYNGRDFVGFHQQVVEQGDIVADCCKEAVARGQLPCCRSKRTHDSGKSKVVLTYNGPKGKHPLTAQRPRHDMRFGITSFIYQARRPFHPERFHQDFVCPFFV
nr:CobW domain-containing protein 1 [Scrippsiella trochoidea]